MSLVFVVYEIPTLFVKLQLEAVAHYFRNFRGILIQIISSIKKLLGRAEVSITRRLYRLVIENYRW